MREVFDWEPFQGFLGEYESVAVKPNLCTIGPPPATTELGLAKEVIRELDLKGKKPLTVESDQATATGDLRAERLGFKDLNTPFVNMTVEFGSKRVQFQGIDDFFEVRMSGLISLAIPKATDIGYFTCATKNLFGLLPTKYKGKYHKRIHSVIRELGDALSHRTFSIVDCRMGMEDKGSPVSGRVVSMPEFYVAGTDPLEVDKWLAVNLCGFELDNIPYLQGLPDPDVSGLEVFEQLRAQCPKIGHFRPTKLTLEKRAYYWVWEHLDNPLLAPIRIVRSLTK
jgi:uncharacterized protein (DUF362 family)